MLPTAGPQANGTSGSFYYMLEKYGLQSAVSAGGYNIAAEPLYFVRSGDLGPDNGKSWYAGQHGYWWSSRGSSTRYDGVTTPSAYNLHFYATGVDPSAGPDNRWLGFSLRCLSTVLDI